MAHVEVTLQATVREIGTGNATFSERGFHPDRIADDRANETNDGLDVVAHDMAEELFRYARAVSFRSEEAFELARIDDVLAILVIMPAEFVFARLRGLSLGRRNGRAQSIQETALDGLVEGQSGPVKMLDELSAVLTPLADPKEKLEAANRQWKPDWDPKRVWIDAFDEEDRNVKIQGHARTNDDLAELLRRLEGARHFVNTRLMVSEVTELRELNNARVVKFEIEAMAIYGAADVAKLAAGTLGMKKKKK